MTMRARIYDWLRRHTSAKTRQWFKRRRWFMPVAQKMFSTDVYSDSYYEDVERLEKGSITFIAGWIKTNLNPSSILDVGCGPGHMMMAFHEAGIPVYGVDISQSALNNVQEKGLKAQRFDLTDASSELPGIPYDLVVSCEVAEHLEERYAIRFVQKLCRASHRVYITAAEPDPAVGPGMMHFNEQPNSYWIKLFQNENFKIDSELTENAREYFIANDVISYLAKPMIFIRHAEISRG